MYSAEVLSQLRSLNWLTQEIRRVPPGSRESALLQTQIDAVRDRLPDVILGHHDRLARGGQATAAEVVDGLCGHCRARLPGPLVAEISLPGRFNVCPNCGLFLWASCHSGVEDIAKGPGRRSRTRRAGRKALSEG